MDILTTEFVQTLILMIPNFAGFVLLAAVLWMNNNRLLGMLERQLEDCTARRDREEILMVRQPSPPQPPDRAAASRPEIKSAPRTGGPVHEAGMSLGGL